MSTPLTLTAQPLTPAAVNAEIATSAAPLRDLPLRFCLLMSDSVLKFAGPGVAGDRLAAPTLGRPGADRANCHNDSAVLIVKTRS